MKCEYCGNEMGDKDLLLVEGQIQFAKTMTDLVANITIGAAFDYAKKTGKEEREELLKQIAILQDGLEYHKNQADSYAKVLKRMYDLIDDLIDEFENADGICISDLKELKNSIPETALRRI